MCMYVYVCVCMSVYLCVFVCGCVWVCVGVGDGMVVHSLDFRTSLTFSF